MEFKEILVGIDTQPFVDTQKIFSEGLLYYGKSTLTNKYFIKYPYLFEDGKFCNTGEHVIFVYGHVNVGDFLTTCPIEGCGFKTTFPEIAFAQVISNSVKPFDRFEDEVERAYVNFL